MNLRTFTLTFQIDGQDDDDDDKCSACGGPNDDGEGWDGLCGDCADKVAEDDGVAAWVREHHQIDFYQLSEDAQHDWRIRYINACNGEPT